MTKVRQPATTGAKNHRKCAHAHWDAKIVNDPNNPQAERWDRIASRLYEREHPTPS
jgi:hypothetical protein